MDVLNLLALTASAGFFLVLSAYSIYEKEYRASVISALSALLFILLWGTVIIWGRAPFIRHLNILLLISVLLFLTVSFIRYFPKKDMKDQGDIIQFDERDHMFARMNMLRSPGQAEIYYSSYPEKESQDKRTAKDPGLGEPGGKFYDRYFSPAVNAAFSLLDKTSAIRSGTVSERKGAHDPEETVRVIRWLAGYYGAADVGITEMKAYHKYSHHGRQTENWGEPVKNEHKYGIVVVVKMDQDMIGQAPSLPVLLESSRQYVESATIAHLIAEYIRELGYDALSHVDGNYDILAVPMAKDAGLGDVGRMGILVHRKFGPSVRLAVVTTDMPLIPSAGKDEHMEEFCSVCRKCALNCPTGSVPSGNKPGSRNFKHWSADQQTCYAYWRKAGTDCGFCIRVCPYTKKDTLVHRLIRYYISRNPVNQRIALAMDNIFYGKKIGLKDRNDQKRFLGSGD